MTVIHKYQAQKGKLLLPSGYKIIHCDLQNDKITLWAEVNPKLKPYIDLEIKMIGTGDTVPAGHRHLGTTLKDNPYVWHFYIV